MRGRPFQKGQPRPANAGRKKGTKNKLKKVADMLAEAGLDPVREIVLLIPTVDGRDQLRAWFDLLSYCEAKPKARDEESDDKLNPDDYADVTDEQLLKLVEESGPEGA